MTARTELGRELTKLITLDYELQSDSLLSGQAASFEDYRYRCGLVKAFKTAIEYLDHAERKVLRIEDDKESN